MNIFQNNRICFNIKYANVALTPLYLAAAFMSGFALLYLQSRVPAPGGQEWAAGWGCCQTGGSGRRFCTSTPDSGTARWGWRSTDLRCIAGRSGGCISAPPGRGLTRYREDTSLGCPARPPFCFVDVSFCFRDDKGGRGGAKYLNFAPPTCHS